MLAASEIVRSINAVPNDLSETAVYPNFCR
jgi:hypothetical protein